MLGKSGIGGERWLLAVIAQTPRITLTLEKKKKKNWQDVNVRILSGNSQGDVLVIDKYKLGQH